MDLKFTDEQNMLRDMTRNLCADHSSVALVRQMENDPLGLPTALWQQMQQTGLTGIRVPEQYGGMGMGLLDAAVVFEQLGRHLAPGPLFDSAIISAGALVRGGAGCADVLASIASGQTIVVPAWLEPDGGFGPSGVQLKAVRSGDGYVLSGVKRHVFYAKAAHKLLVLARSGDAADALTLLLIDADAQGLAYEQQRSMASDTQYRIGFDQVRVPLSARVGDEDGGWRIWDAVLREGLVLLGAYAAGGAERALEITVQYSKDREQFGKPIGAFQALAHDMADASPVVEGAKVLVYEAAWAHDNGRHDPRLAPMAKLFACNAFRDVTHMAQQVHGGIGFTLDYDIQLYYRRAKQLQLNWWDARHLEGLVAAAVLDSAGRSIPDPFTV